jgi:cysteine desulfurase/selenocysteine lyase
VDENGQILLDEYQKILNEKTKIVSFTHVSNARGTITPAAEMIRLAHKYGAAVLVDGARRGSAFESRRSGAGCDFYAFSGHKLFGPTGIGVLTAEPPCSRPAALPGRRQYDIRRHL